MLAGKRALITGATSGIGQACARLFVKEGATVVATGRNEAALAALTAELGEKCFTVAGDLTETGTCAKVVGEAAKLAGGISTLVNCAGVLKGGAMGAVGLARHHRTTLFLL